MEKIPLSLSENHTDRPSASEQVEESTPLSGYLAVGFGMLGIFGPTFIYATWTIVLIDCIVTWPRGMGVRWFTASHRRHPEFTDFHGDHWPWCDLYDLRLAGNAAATLRDDWQWQGCLTRDRLAPCRHVVGKRFPQYRRHHIQCDDKACGPCWQV